MAASANAPKSVEELFLTYSVDTLSQMTGHIHTCFAKLDEEAIWRRQSSNENALGNLVLHLCGNVRQWIGAYVGGLEDIRKRPEEFSATDGLKSAELLKRLDETVDMAIKILKSLDPKRLTDVVPVQDGKTAAILEAIYQVVGHFRQHTGQIIFATKLMTTHDLGFYKPAGPRHV